MAEEQKNGWNEWSKHIIRELERLNNNTERLREDLQKSNTEITKLQTLQKELSELKHGTSVLRQEIDKNSYRFESRVDERIKESIGNLTESIKKLSEDKDALSNRISELDGQKKYIRGIIVTLIFVVTSMIAILGLFNWGSVGG